MNRQKHAHENTKNAKGNWKSAKDAVWRLIQEMDGIVHCRIVGGDSMKKDLVFEKLLFMYEQAEKSVNRFLSGDDEQLLAYGLNKIDLTIRQIAQQYQEAER